MNPTGRRHKVLSREESIRFHARRCAAERFGPMGPRKYESLIRQIQTGESRFLGRRSYRLTRHLVNIDGVPAVACYDSMRKLIVTLLPFHGNEGES